MKKLATFFVLTTYFLLALVLQVNAQQSIKIVNPQNQSAFVQSKINFGWSSSVSGNAILTYATDSALTNPTQITVTGNDTTLYFNAGTYFYQITQNISGAQSDVTKFEVFFPNQIDSLKLWLKPEGIVYNANYFITNWYDSSLTARHAAQTNVATQPMADTFKLNHFTTLKLDGVNDFVEFPEVANIRTAITVFKHETGIQNDYIPLFGHTTQDPNDFFGVPGNLIFSTGATNNHVINGTARLNTQPILPVNIIRPTQFSILSLTTTGNVRANNLSRFAFYNRVWHGSFAEVMFFSQVLPVTQQQLIERYLKTKYQPKIVLPHQINWSYGVCPLTIIPLTGNSQKSFAWSTGDTTAQITVNQGGKYLVNATGYFGVNSTDSVLVIDTRKKLNQITDTTICKNQQITWNTLMPNSYQFLWSNGQTDSLITITQEGDYWVKVTDSTGCYIMSDTVHIEVDDFTENATLGPDTTLCQGEPIRLLQSEHLAVDFNWNTGQNTSSIIPSNSGTYVLAATSANNCLVIDTINITLAGQAPTVNFLFNHVCQNQQVIFTDSSVAAQGDFITEKTWFVNNQVIDTGNTTNYTFTNSGKQQVAVLIKTQQGCSKLKTDSISIYANPKPSFSVTNLCSGKNVLFQNTSLPQDGNLVTQQISVTQKTTNQFLGNYLVDSFSVNIQDSGLYEVSVYAENSLGCQFNTDSLVYINLSPLALFTRDSACAGQPISFNYQENTQNKTVNWFINNQSFSSNFNPNFLFDSAGAYNLMLTVADSAQCTDTVVETILISEPTTFNQLQNPYILCANNFVNWTTNLNQNQFTFLWNTQQTTNNINITQPGNYSVNITDSLGCSFISNTVVVFIDSFPISASLGPDTALCEGNHIALQVDVNQAINYLWSNLDTTETIAIINPGNYSLTVTNHNGCTAIDTILVAISGTAAQVSIFKNNVCLLDSSYLVDVTQMPQNQTTVNRVWTINNQTFTDSTVKTYFELPGKYPVKLQLFSNIGCLSEGIDTVEVYNLPEVNFSTSVACKNAPTQFQEQVSIPLGTIQNYQWNILHMNQAPVFQSNNHFFDFSFDSTALYIVELLATSNQLCTTTKVDTITVFEKPNPTFTFQKTCANQPATFMPVNNHFSSVWKINNNQIFTTDTLQNNFNQPGQYAIKFIAISTTGCTDSSIQNIKLLLPDTNFNQLQNFTLCQNDSVIWQTNLPNTFDFNWNNGAQTNFLKITENGIFQVTVTDTTNCSFTSNPVTVNTDSFAHKIDLGVDTNICKNNQIGLKKGAQLSTGYLWSNAQQTPQITIQNSGKYFVTVTNANNCLAIDSILVTVIGEAPEVNFSFIEQCATDSVVFTNSSQPPNGNTISQWNWSFGNGLTSTLQNPKMAFSSGGFYEVLLTAQTNVGCIGSKTDTVEIYNLPNPNFTSSKSCSKRETQFLNTTPLASEYFWKFSGVNQGFLGTDSTQNSNFLFNNSGIHLVKLIATNSFGCRDSIEKIVNTINTPIANFTPSTFCGQDSILFTNTTSGFYQNSLWNFGFGNTSTQKNPTWLFDTVGQFPVSLIVNSSLGCSDTTVKVLPLRENPIVNFNIPNKICGNDSLLLSPIADSNLIPHLQYYWEITDTLNQVIFNGNKLVENAWFNYKGLANVKLMATDTFGCTQTTQKSIDVLPFPQASFSSQYACISDSVLFTNSSTASAGIANYLWTFNNQLFDSIQNPKKLFFNAGNYNIKLQITDSNQCKSIASEKVKFTGFENFAFLPADTVICADSIFEWNLGLDTTFYDILWNTGNTSNTQLVYQPDSFQVQITDTLNCSFISNYTTVNFSNFALLAHLGPDRFICSGDSVGLQAMALEATGFLWSTGDTTPKIQISSSGLYSLTAQNNIGCTMHDTVELTIKAPAPTALFNYTGNCQGDSLILQNTSSVTNQNILQSQFIINQTDTLYGNYVSYFTTDTAITVKLQIETDSSCHAQFSQNILNYKKPQALFSLSGRCETDTVLAFDLTNVNGSFLNRSWTITSNSLWQTGSIDSLPIVIPSDSTLMVKLEVTNTNGCTDSVSQTIYIKSKPQLNYALNYPCINTLALVQNQIVADSLTQITWNFNGSLYNNFGNWNLPIGNDSVLYLTLQATDSNACSQTLFDTILVNKPILLHQSFADTTICNGDSILWNSGLTGNVNLLWNTLDSTPSIKIWNDGFYSFQVTDSNQCIAYSDTFEVTVNPFSIGFSLGNDTSFCSGNTITVQNLASEVVGIQYSTGNTQLSDSIFNSGTYWANATNALGCVATDTIQVYILGATPNPNFQFTNQCILDSTMFTDLSGIAITDTIALRHWQFSNGISKNGQIVTNYFASTGVFQATLTVTTTKGCQAQVTKPVEIFQLPIPNFGNTLSCNNRETEFFDQTSSPDGPIVKQFWDFGDPFSSPSQNTDTSKFPKHIYTGVGSYIVQYEVENSLGCKNKTSKVILVSQTPEASFTSNNVCFGELSKFENTTTGNFTYLTWHFGNNFIAQGPQATHLYDSAGVYNVSLVTETNFGCIDTLTKLVEIYARPQANFTGNNFCEQSEIELINTSAATGQTLISSQWKIPLFGNFIGNQISFFVPDSGNYQVNLTVKNNNNCADSTSKIIKIHGKPQANFNLLPDYGAAPLTVKTENNSSQFYSNTWLLNDSVFSLDESPEITFNSNGIYSIKLINTNSFLCADSLIKTIRVFPPLLDLALVSVTAEKNIKGFFETKFVVKNMGTRTITNFEMLLTTPEITGIRESFNTVLTPGMQAEFVFSATLNAPDYGSFEYLCVEINTVEETEDDHFENNKNCIANKTLLLKNVYPNPATNKAIIEFVAYESDLCQIKIYDQYGKEMFTVFDGVCVSGLNYFELQVENLETGLYFVRVFYKNDFSVKPMQIAR